MRRATRIKQMKTVSKFSLVLILAGLTAAGINGFSQSKSTSPPAAANHRLDKLAGAWSVETTAEIQQITFPGLFTFHADGCVLGSQLPIGTAFETPGHGNWIATSPEGAAYTFVGLFADENGSLVAKAKAVGTLRYDPRTDTWSGPFKIHVYDPDGNEFFTDSGMISATRIAVETLD
jgi:hypothetical protein